MCIEKSLRIRHDHIATFAIFSNLDLLFNSVRVND
jgi:hypothetical protein